MGKCTSCFISSIQYYSNILIFYSYFHRTFMFLLLMRSANYLYLESQILGPGPAVATETKQKQNKKLFSSNIVPNQTREIGKAI